MTAPLLDTYTACGVDLRNLSTHIEVAEGLQSTPGVVGDDVVDIIGLDGAYDPYADPSSVRRSEAAGSITFSMSLLGVSRTTGLVPGSSSTGAEYFSRWDELVRLFHRRTVPLTHPRADGTTRTAFGRVVGALEPSREISSPWFGRFKVTLTIAGAFWEDGTVVDTGLVTVASGGTLDLSAFATATAPCVCSTRFGPGNNPAVTLNSRILAWDAVIAAGRQVLVDPAGYTSQGAGSAWTPGYTPLRRVGLWSGFEVDPSDAAQVATVSTTGGSVQVQVSGKRRYRTS